MIKKEILKPKNMIIGGLLIIAIILGIIYLINQPFRAPKEELDNPIIVRVEDQEVRLNDILYFKGMILETQQKNLSLHQSMDSVIQEEILYFSALKNGFNLTDEEIEKTLNGEVLNQYEFNYYKKYYIIDKYKKHIFKTSSKDFSITDEEARNLFEFTKENYPKTYPPFEEVKSELKEILRRQEEVNYLDEYTTNLREDMNIEYINNYILDDLSIYKPGMDEEEFYDIFFGRNETEKNSTNNESDNFSKELISLN